jgi:serine phosphatase RsbU (regulator of sigma subunit)
VRALSLVTSSPAKILRHANRLLLAEEHEQFVSALLVVLDPLTGNASLASAGHPPPALLSQEGVSILEPKYGPLLGLFEASYQARAFTLLPDATLVFYTDGLTEARRDGELFGERRLLEALGACPDRQPETVIEQLRATVLTYAGSLQDDLEMVAVGLRAHADTAAALPTRRIPTGQHG